MSQNRSGATRREFLVKSAVLAAATAPLSIGRSAHAAGSDVIKVGLIGCGGRGSGAAANALEADHGTKLVAMADLFDDKAKGSRDLLKKQFKEQVAVDDQHCFSGFDAYSKVLASGIDVVLIACASRFHPEYAKAAIDAGKHVFVEKPHATHVPGLHMIEAACEAAKKKNLSVVSGLCWRYHTGVQETMKRVLDGAIGDVIAVQETYLRSPYRIIERRPDQKDELEYQCRNWYHFNWLSGDDILQSLVHSLDKGAWALRDEPPVRAFGVGGRSSSHDRPFVYGDVFDHNAIVYEYASGARMYGLGRAQSNCFNDVSSLVLGTKGRANLEKFRIEGTENWEYKGPKCNMTVEEQRVLMTSIRTGKPVNNGTYMVRSTMTGIMGRMTCYTGKAVTWDDAMKSTHVIGPAKCAFDMTPPVMPDANGFYPTLIPGFCKEG